LAEEVLVHPGAGRGPVRRPDGRRPRRIRETAVGRRAVSVHGRGEQAVAAGWGTGGADETGRTETGGLPLRAAGDAGNLLLLRSTPGLATGDDTRQSDASGLRRGSAAPARRGVPECEDGSTGLRQPEHARDRLAVRSVPAGGSPPAGPPLGISPHAAERKLAERGRNRTQRPRPAMPSPTDRQRTRTANGSRRVDRGTESNPSQGGVAPHHPGCPHPIEKTLPTSLG